VELTHPLAVITPTLDGDVLSILALADADFTASRLHGLLPTRGKRGIDKVLARLVEQGVVMQTHVGRPNLYRLNREHLAADAVVALARQKDTLLERLRHELASWKVPAVYAALFGSGARGDHGSTSDIDLLFIRPDEVDHDDWDAQVEALSARVTAWTGNDARAISYATREVAERGAHEPLLAEIVKEGISLAGDPNWLRRALKRGSAA